MHSDSSERRGEAGIQLDSYAQMNADFDDGSEKEMTEKVHMPLTVIN